MECISLLSHIGVGCGPAEERDDSQGCDSCGPGRNGPRRVPQDGMYVPICIYHEVVLVMKELFCLVHNANTF